MEIKKWTPALIGLFLATGTVQAFADGGWYYDEDTQTIIYEYSGSPVIQSPSSTEDAVPQHQGYWYHDEASDTIVFNVEGSRAKYIRSNPSGEAVFDLEFAFLDQ